MTSRGKLIARNQTIDGEILAADAALEAMPVERFAQDAEGRELATLFTRASATAIITGTFKGPDPVGLRWDWTEHVSVCRLLADRHLSVWMLVLREPIQFAGRIGVNSERSWLVADAPGAWRAVWRTAFCRLSGGDQRIGLVMLSRAS